MPNLTSQYRIEVSDFFGNSTIISIPIVNEVLPVIITKEPVDIRPPGTPERARQKRTGAGREKR